MSKMNWEHRNKMQKVYDNPPRRPAKKRKRPKGRAANPVELQRHLGHVKMASKYNSRCALCIKAIHVGNVIWWNPDDKYVAHEQCFRKFMM